MELLKKLYEINSQSEHIDAMREFICQQLETTKAKIEDDEYGNIFVTRGKSEQYPCLLAHMDEVHEPAKRVIMVNGNVIKAVDSTGQPIGCGADDKNGIWIILKMFLETHLSMKAVFFADEEIGCNGSYYCDMSFFNDVSFIMALDRRGGNDLVTVGFGFRLSDDNYWDSATLKRFGYTPTKGGMTDVVELRARGLNIPSCNISVGYYNAHRPTEYTKISELRKAYVFTKAMMGAMGHGYVSDSTHEEEHWETLFRKAVVMIDHAQSMADKPELEDEMWMFYVKARVYIQTEEFLYHRHANEYTKLYAIIDPVLDRLNPKYSEATKNHEIW